MRSGQVLRESQSKRKVEHINTGRNTITLFLKPGTENLALFFSNENSNKYIWDKNLALASTAVLIGAVYSFHSLSRSSSLLFGRGEVPM